MITITTTHINGVNIITIHDGEKELIWGAYHHSPVPYGFCMAEIKKIEKVLEFTGQLYKTVIKIDRPIKGRL